MTVLGRAALNYALYENLGLSRKAASWVPHNLSEELKQMPINIAKGFMKLKEGMRGLIYFAYCDNGQDNFVFLNTIKQRKEQRLEAERIFVQCSSQLDLNQLHFGSIVLSPVTSNIKRHSGVKGIKNRRLGKPF